MYGYGAYGAGCTAPVANYGVGNCVGVGNSCVGAGVISIAILILIALGVIFAF